MQISAYILAAVALAGSFGSTVFLGMAIVAAIRYRRQSALQRAETPGDADGARRNGASLPPISVIKPLHGAEPRLRENLESFFRQDYPKYELLFCARRRDDPALAVVDELRARYPQVECTVLACGEPPYPNAKVFSLTAMLRAAKYEMLVMGDSDVHVDPDYLREVTRPLLDPRNGLVTCIYRGVPTGGFWSLLEALGMSVEMTSGVIIAEMLEGMKFALGPTIAMRRDSLEAIGGMEQLRDYCAEDFVMGQWAQQRGYGVVLSAYVIDHMTGDHGFRGSWKHQVRWMLSARFSRPAGHFGTGITFAVPFGMMAMAAGVMLGHPMMGAALLGWSVLNRVIQSAVIGGAVLHDRLAVRYCWLYPLRDLLGFFVWMASYAGNEVVWRGVRYRLIEDGKMFKVGGE